MLECIMSETILDSDRTFECEQAKASMIPFTIQCQFNCLKLLFKVQTITCCRNILAVTLHSYSFNDTRDR